MIFVLHATDVLLRGGVIAYPTEGVFGLGCLPDDESALQRILAIKRRDASKGLILIAADAMQFDGWIDLPTGEFLPEPHPARPTTWIVPPGPLVTPTLRGDHESLLAQEGFYHNLYMSQYRRVEDEHPQGARSQP